MDDYRVYRLDGVGQIGFVELFEAIDDGDAIAQARQLGRHGLKCELWRGRRLVITLNSCDLAG